MQLNVIINEDEFASMYSKIKEIGNYITLYIQDKTGYIANGIQEKNDAFYFGEYEPKSNKYQIISLALTKENNQKVSYDAHHNIVNRFIEKWSRINLIKTNEDYKERKNNG